MNNETVKVENKEDIEQSKETQIIDSQISKIKSTFTPEILNKNPDIQNLINSFDLQKEE